MRAAAAASGRAQGLESVEREAVHLAVEAHVRHVPVAATVEFLDPVRRDLGHGLVVEDQPRRLVLLHPCHVVPALGRAALVRDDGEELVPGEGEGEG